MSATATRPRRRRTYYLEAPLRRAGLVLAPVVLLALAAAVVVQLLPPRYRASVLVRAEWEVTDEALMRQHGIDVASRRTQAVRQRVTERALLQRVLREAEPYATGRATLSLDEATERLLSDLRVRSMASSSFVIEFVHRDAATAARVPNLLARSLAEGEDDARGQAGGGSRGPITRFELLREAAVPGAQESPKPVLFVLAGAFAGLLTGLAASVVAEHRDRRVKGPEDLAGILPVPLLATLPEVRTQDRR